MKMLVGVEIVEQFIPSRVGYARGAPSRPPPRGPPSGRAPFRSWPYGLFSHPDARVGDARHATRVEIEASWAMFGVKTSETRPASAAPPCFAKFGVIQVVHPWKTPNLTRTRTEKNQLQNILELLAESVAPLDGCSAPAGGPYCKLPPPLAALSPRAAGQVRRDERPVARAEHEPPRVKRDECDGGWTDVCTTFRTLHALIR